MGGLVKTDATNANVRYASTTTLALGQIETLGDVSLLASSITNNLVNGSPFNNITADELKITANSLATSSKNLKTDVATLSGNIAGDIFITEADDVNIGQTSEISVTTVNEDGTTIATTDAIQTKLTASGNLVLQAGGTVTSLSSTGDIEASGNILVKAANITSNSAILSTSGNITLDATTNININENITTQAVNKTIDIFSTSGNVIMSDNAQVSTNESNIRVKANDFTISSLDAGNANVSLFLTGVFADAGDTNTDIIANKLRVYLSGTGVADANTQDIETSINLLSAVVNQNGLYLDNNKDILISNVESMSVNKVGTNGTTTARTDVAQDNIASTGTVSLKVSGSILDRADNNVSIVSDKLILNSTSVGSSTNALNTQVGTLSVDALSDVTINETDDLILDTLTSLTDINITASNVTNTSSSLLTANSLTLDVTSVNINTDITTLIATATSDVTINESNDLILDGITTDTNIDITAANLTNTQNSSIVSNKLTLDVTSATIDTDIGMLNATATADLTINESDNLVVEDIQTPSTVIIQTADSMKIGTINANTVTLKADSGRITDYYNNQTTNVTAQNLNMIGKGATTDGSRLNGSALDSLANAAINTDVRNLFVANVNEAKIESKIGSTTNVFLVEKDNYSLQVVNNTIVTPQMSQIETTIDLTGYSDVQRWDFVKEVDYGLYNSSFVMNTHYVQDQQDKQTRVVALFDSINNPQYVNNTKSISSDSTVQIAIKDVLTPISLNYSNYITSFDSSLLISEIDSELFEYWIEDIAL